MRTRRHLLAAGAIAATQILALMVATDVLGADIGDYATRSSSIETVGGDLDLDRPARGDEGQGEAAPGGATLESLESAALESAALESAALESSGVDAGATDLNAPADHAKSSIPEPKAPTTTSGPPTSSGPEASVEQPQSTLQTTAPPTSAATSESAASNGPTESGSVAGEASGALVGDAGSSSSLAPTPSTVPAAPATPTSVVQVGRPVSSPPSVTTTTWLPVTTRNVITTWATNAITSVTSPGSTTTTDAASTTASASTTTAPATQAPTSATTSTAPPVVTAPGTAGATALEAIRNTNPLFSRFADVPSVQLDLDQLTDPVARPDNGSVGDGQFRAACLYSHFAYDDPIVFPGEPGRSHLHMFFGNTRVNANTTTDSLVNSGGGSCNGFELNRSAYWVPALLDGKGNAVAPETIILYYKSKHPGQVQRMPQGLKMISGNTSAESFTTSQFLFWSCGPSGRAYNVSNRIPDCGGDTINASIVFPQCWDGTNLDSDDHRAHMALVNPELPCPSTHPVRLPQISILLYFPGQPSVRGWHLSSDRTGGFNSGPGATLHADWWGGWNDEAMDLWTEGCMKRARNCSFGQTGTNRALARLNPLQKYDGETFLPLP